MGVMPLQKVFATAVLQERTAQPMASCNIVNQLNILLAIQLVELLAIVQLITIAQE